MQWPPTRPGLKGRKFHLVPAAASTSWVSMSRRWKMSANSFIMAMLTSRWVFSITFAASATFKLGALWVPAVIMRRYRASTNSAALGVEPDVTLTIVVRRRCRSPGLMRSGL